MSIDKTVSKIGRWKLVQGQVNALLMVSSVAFKHLITIAKTSDSYTMTLKSWSFETVAYHRKSLQVTTGSFFRMFDAFK